MTCKSWKPQEEPVYIYVGCLTCVHRNEYPECPENTKTFRDYNSSNQTIIKETEE